jgi:hypothetical protein
VMPKLGRIDRMKPAADDQQIEGWSEELVEWRPLGSLSNSFIGAPWTWELCTKHVDPRRRLQFIGTCPTLATQLPQQAPPPSPSVAAGEKVVGRQLVVYVSAQLLVLHAHLF